MNKSLFICSTSACDQHCSSCESNGAGKCDPGKCSDGYVLNTASKQCEGKMLSKV